MKTNVSNYALAAIFSIMDENNEVHPVAFHSYTFTSIELNYNTHNEKLLLKVSEFGITISRNQSLPSMLL